MNIMGNQAIRNGEITPNNFATKPGAFSKSNILTKPDYLFGSNMGLTAEENNLSISTNAVRTKLPLPIHFKTPKLGSIMETAKENPLPTLLLLYLLSYPAQKITNKLYKRLLK